MGKLEQNPFANVNVPEALFGPWASVASVVPAGQLLNEALKPYVQKDTNGNPILPTRLAKMIYPQPNTTSPNPK